MALKKHKNRYRAQEVEEVNLDDWLATYGDMVTLLMCFFLLLISVSDVDVLLWEEMKKGLRSEIVKSEERTPLAEIKWDLDQILEPEREQGIVDIQLGRRGIQMEFASSAFYAPGSAELGPVALEIVEKVINAIKAIDYYKFQIDVEGHTDDVPISTARFPSNWELSVARATNIIKYSIDQGIEPERLKAAGYADTKPVLPNRNPDTGAAIPENQAKNRRIVIKIH
jgi:chemotaxis protein MotB